jgi:hypothetical protein
MATFDSTPVTNSSKSNNFGFPILSAEAVNVMRFDALDGIPDLDPSARFPGDPATITRSIFRDEVRDVLLVLKTCGFLRTRAECLWCLQELGRLLDELCADKPV